jgi:hypothetical protein
MGVIVDFTSHVLSIGRRVSRLIVGGIKGCFMGYLDDERARGARLRSSGHMLFKRMSLP